MRNEVCKVLATTATKDEMEILEWLDKKENPNSLVMRLLRNEMGFNNTIIDDDKLDDLMKDIEELFK